MANQKREQIGSFIITTEKNLASDGIICAMCEKKLSHYDPITDRHSPSAEALHQAGNIAIPNFGWFCSQECAAAYEQKFGFSFGRNAQGKIDFYGE